MCKHAELVQSVAIATVVRRRRDLQRRGLIPRQGSPSKRYARAVNADRLESINSTAPHTTGLLVCMYYGGTKVRPELDRRALARSALY